MASAPDSQESPTLPLPLTPMIDSSPTTDSPPPPDSSSPPPPTPSSPPPEVATPPPPEVPTPPPIDILLPPPLVLDPPPPLPPPPETSTPVVSPPPPSSPSPPPPTPEVSPPPPSPPPAGPTPSVDSPSPPPPSSPPKSVKSPPPSSPSTTIFSPPPPKNSSSHHVPPPPSSSSENSTPNPKSKPSTSDAKSTMLQDSNSDNDQAVKTGIAIGVVVAFLFIGFMLVIVCVRRRRKRHDRYNSVHMLPSQFVGSQVSGSSFMKPMPSVGGGFSSGGGGFGGIGGGSGGSEFMSSSADSGMLGNSMTAFSYEQLNTATNGFATQNILGAGGFGCVYKGFLQDGRVVAVKKLKDNSGQGDREFKAEVETISRVHHRHLVSLVGYCATDYQRLLVYEFLPNNTLHYHLHAANKPVMEWSLRVKVACGAARGLAYLHEDCHPKIIHRDIKSANIILDQNFEAKVADFGLAKLAQELDLNTHVSTRVMGTFGYMAPEYASSGKLTEKSDVFSFGVVLLELITARKPVDERRPLGDESLVEWARPLMSEALESQNFSELADSRLQGNYDRGEMFRMIEAAAACVRHSSTKRPKMSQVVRALDTMSELSDISNGMKPGESGIFDSREQSMQIRMFQRMAFGSQDMSSSEYGNSQSSWANGGRSGFV